MDGGVKVGGRLAAPDVVPATAWAELFSRRAARGGGELTAILSLAASKDVITFSGGFPAPETFPVDVLRELTEELLSEEAALALQYSPTVCCRRGRRWASG
jgi:2-aminoadipate transaminase